MIERIKKFKIPVQKLRINEPIPYTLLDEADRVMLFAGQVLTEPFLRFLENRGVYHVVAEIVENGQEQIARQDVSQALKEVTLHNLEETMNRLVQDKPVSLKPVKDSVWEIIREIMNHHELVVPIAQLKKHDDLTFTHSLNVAIIALLIGRYLDLSEDEMVTLGLGAMFHDLGKLKIPLEILAKSDRLTDREFQTIKLHPLFAKKLLDEKTDLSEGVKQVVFQHHEKKNGTGYPLGVKYRGIAPLAAIVSVADIFDALTSNRPYRQAIPVPEALEYLMGNAGYTLDEKAVRTFIHHLSPFQIGDEVLLSSGERARVVGINHHVLFRPLVRIVNKSEEGERVPVSEIDLSRNLTLTILSSQ
ncbi:MAG TPA: HD-GYP domain-containing protein [Atribacteraceae bacterium]|nr:HD-GYP domain-containing protein [Atribacteraceae bacterium]